MLKQNRPETQPGHCRAEKMSGMEGGNRDCGPAQTRSQFSKYSCLGGCRPAVFYFFLMPQRRKQFHLEHKTLRLDTWINVPAMTIR